MEKRGQFYLIASVVIVSLIIGVALISNSLKRGNSTNVVEALAEELEIESEYVFDYIIANDLDVEENILNFTDGFYNSSDEGYELYVLFGKKIDLNCYKYSGVGRESFTYTQTDENATITLDEIDYVFDLREGQHFYYVITKEVGGERYVARN